MHHDQAIALYDPGRHRPLATRFGQDAGVKPAVTATFRDSSPVALCSSRIDTLGDTAYSRVWSNRVLVMPVRARAVANEFIHLAKADGRSLTPLQLIKLTYIAHGWMLAFYGRPLIVDEVEAWKYGPVIPDLYQAMRRYGSAYVTKDLGTWGSRAASRLDETERGIIHQVYRAYGEQNGVQLSRLTHQSGTPWYQTRNASGQNAVIANDLIAEHYRLLNDERRAKTASGRS